MTPLFYWTMTCPALVAIGAVINNIGNPCYAVETVFILNKALVYKVGFNKKLVLI
jgi:hypothetical protein